MKNLLIWTLPILLFGCQSKRQCNIKSIEIPEGDTITYRYPNIPDSLNNYHANFTWYYKQLDSVVITHAICN